MKNIMMWVGTGLSAMLAIGAVASGDIIFGLFFVFLALIVSPKREDVINILPEKFQKKGIIIAVGAILFIAGGLTLSNEDKNNEKKQMVNNDTTTETISNEDNTEEKDASEITTQLEENSTTENKTETADEKNTEESVTTTQAVTETQQSSSTETIQAEATEASTTAQSQTTEEVQITQESTTEVAQTTQESTASNNIGGGDLTGYPATQPLEGKIVYITNTGQKYHEGNCRMLKDSKIEISLEEAESRGYTPCGICH